MIERLLEALPPEAVFAITIIAAALITTIAGVIVWAFLQGRQVHLGPLSIGPAIEGLPRHRSEKRGNSLSWPEIEHAVQNLHTKMVDAHYRPKYIICMGRGGAVIGAMLSQAFKSPVIPIAVLTVDHKMSSVRPDNQGGGLVRDYSINEICTISAGLENALFIGVDVITGFAMHAGSRELARTGVEVSATACLFWKPDSGFHPSFYGDKCEGRRLYPWMKTSFKEAWGLAH